VAAQRNFEIIESAGAFKIGWMHLRGEEMVAEKIIIRSPTRVDLAGGTLDLWPLYAILSGAQTVNVAIDVFSHCELEVRKTADVDIVSDDLQKSFHFAKTRDILLNTDRDLALYQTVVEYFKPQFGFRLHTRSESPIGGGLGGSSSLLISMMKAFSRATGKKFRDIHHMVDVAHHMEAKVLSTPTGKQDYYPAVSGGLSVMHFNWDGITHESLPVSQTQLAEYFILVYTGKSHHSGLNNFSVLTQVAARNQSVIDALNEVKLIATDMENLVRKNAWHDIDGLLKREYDARIQLAPEFSSPEIEVLKRFASAITGHVKICGAGGGGCVMVWCPPAGRASFEEACKSKGFRILNTRPVDPLEDRDEWFEHSR
jgi:D-glycero-alpha-D-manno-heptose-7-phosphate kinase